eukprot:TRINITY_DN55540_c0_g1_i1.p1 TRINITY_DN55540_c0_g1~~TRINITY_DN55540_c0_g1_i1.p1  ORF type:complete len:344 (-),score=34.83 TRINITY_DN55540_c0_g1_i1:77-1108(-)
MVAGAPKLRDVIRAQSCVAVFLSLVFLVAGEQTSCEADLGDVFKSTVWLHSRLAANNVTVVDARGSNVPSHIRGALQSSWQKFAQGSFGSPDGGLLRSVDELRASLASQLGVTPTREVIVYGAWSKGWGEEGRIYWMLKYLGHPSAYILMGGFDAFAAKHPGTIAPGAGAASSTVAATWEYAKAGPGAVDAIRATSESIMRERPLLVDVRMPHEYDGTMERPYGVSRSGHAASAVNFPFSDLFHSDGCLLPCRDVLGRLREAGWQRSRGLAAYCTGGIRSAFFWAVLRECGLEASNYDGSMWEWAADPSLPMSISADSSYLVSLSRTVYLATCIMPLFVLLVG